ncbi:hypothetical protein [Salinibacter ruber]|uniref:Uncharacterized protein n=2 Tax=Salinibacter ruber TaxID=146919 RepID=A0A9X2UPU2_9BACT|nr:hypothetical protein [Salinibacter ruber]MCS3616919.1 hypothetical protein [Salinibacter ruber]MCS4038300.1 hypothetical protein [Salinibacter ruber]
MASHTLRTREWQVLFLLAMLLGVGAQSPIAAQSGNHTVKVDVQDIVEFEIDNNVNLVFDEANGIDGVDLRHTWEIEGQPDKTALSSASASTQGEYAEYSIATNREGLKIIVTGFNTNIDAEDLELAVRLRELDSEQRPESFTNLTEVGSGFSGGITVAENLGPIDKSGNTLSYYGIVTPGFDLKQDGDIKIFYTVTK